MTKYEKLMQEMTIDKFVELDIGQATLKKIFPFLKMECENSRKCSKFEYCNECIFAELKKRYTKNQEPELNSYYFAFNESRTGEECGIEFKNKYVLIEATDLESAKSECRKYFSKICNQVLLEDVEGKELLIKLRGELK
jgi:hypothetical protein